MQARFQRLRNDLFWEVFDREQDKFIRWMGYDDSYWWNNVANSEQFQVRGKYRLDPFTNEVRILTMRAGDEWDSPASEHLSTLEVSPVEQAESTPALRA